MERARTRLRSRPSDPPQLSPAQPVPDSGPANSRVRSATHSATRPKQRSDTHSAARSVARSTTKRKRQEPKNDPPAGRQKRGRSIPCQTTTDRNSTAATGITAGAQSVTEIGSSNLRSQGQNEGQQSSNTQRCTSAVGERLTVTNDILSSLPSNGETLVINKDALTELIGIEIEKKMTGLGNNIPTNPSASANNIDSNLSDTQNIPTSQNAFQTNMGVTNPGLSGSQGLEQAVSTLLNAPGERDNSLINTMKCDLPLDSSVSDKVRSQIISREFIDLGCLLSTEFDKDMNFNVSVGDDGPSIVLNSSRKAKPIIHINGWISAMHIYGSIYLRAHPEEVSPFFPIHGIHYQNGEKGQFLLEGI